MSDINPIKDAFSKIKDDILYLNEQILTISQQISYVNQQIDELKRTLNEKKPTENENNTSIQQINPAINQNPTDNSSQKALKSSFKGISIGNGGVPTDKPTDRQTNQQTDTSDQFLSHFQFHPDQNISHNDRIDQIQRVSEVLESLDSIKKEIRTNFKKLTSQEMAVFSSIYTLEEQGFVVDYSLISEKLELSESSIRDYVNKITKKGIPLIKSKENNKRVILSVSSELKKIASLQTILTLRKI